MTDGVGGGGVLRPAPLPRGAAVAVLAPSSPVLADRLERGLEILRGWGYEPVEMPHLRATRGHLAGSDGERLADLHEALGRRDLRAVWVARGGFGATRIAGRVDWAGMVADPRPLIGFSDATALLHAAWSRARLLTVHGGLVGALDRLAGDTTAATHLRGMLGGRARPGDEVPYDGGITVVPGVAEGRLLGGNLAVVCAMLGTPLQIDLTGAVLLLEDVNEVPYRVDRMLTQLRATGALRGIAGILLGGFVGCEPPDDRPSASVEEVLAERLGDLGVPVLAGVPAGHGRGQLALPHGARVRLDASGATLALLESVTA